MYRLALADLLLSPLRLFPSISILAVWFTMSLNVTSQTAVWLMYLSRTWYHVAPGDLPLDMVVEVVRESPASQGRLFLSPEVMGLMDDPGSPRADPIRLLVYEVQGSTLARSLVNRLL